MRAAKELFRRTKGISRSYHIAYVSGTLLSNRKQSWRMKLISIELGHKNEDDVF